MRRIVHALMKISMFNSNLLASSISSNDLDVLLASGILAHGRSAVVGATFVKPCQLSDKTVRDLILP